MTRYLINDAGNPRHLVGGASDHKGITFSSDNYRVEIKTFPRVEIGDVKPLGKGKDSKIRTRFLALLIILSLGEILHKDIPLQIGNMISGISFIFRIIIVIFLIGLIILVVKRSGIKGFGDLRTNHGAEHKVIEAYNNGKIENAQKFERFSRGCGSYLVIPIIMIIILGDWIFYPFTICLLYYVGYMYLRPVRDIMFIMIGMPLQYLVTKEPVPEILNATKEGLSKLIYEEEVRHMANWCSKRDAGDVNRKLEEKIRNIKMTNKV